MRAPAGIADKGVPVRVRQRMGHAMLSRKEISGALGPAHGKVRMRLEYLKTAKDCL